LCFRAWKKAKIYCFFILTGQLAVVQTSFGLLTKQQKRYFPFCYLLYTPRLLTPIGIWMLEQNGCCCSLFAFSLLTNTYNFTFAKKKWVKIRIGFIISSICVQKTKLKRHHLLKIMIYLQRQKRKVFKYKKDILVLLLLLAFPYFCLLFKGKSDVLSGIFHLNNSMIWLTLPNGNLSKMRKSLDTIWWKMKGHEWEILLILVKDFLDF